MQPTIHKNGIVLCIVHAYDLHRVTENVPPFACYNFEHTWTDFNIFCQKCYR